MIILGIDPGLSWTGYGVVEKERDKLKPLGFGEVNTPPKAVLSSRLGKIYGEVKEIMERYHPDVVVLEELFFNTNRRSAMAVGQARGVILLAAEHSCLAVEEYTPLQVKQALVGSGRADKRQVKYMVRTLLSIADDIHSSHASDALALAICHAHHHKISSLLGGRAADRKA